MIYLEPLIQTFREAANPGKVQKMNRYLNGLFPCQGLDKKYRTPCLRILSVFIANIQKITDAQFSGGFQLMVV